MTLPDHIVAEVFGDLAALEPDVPPCPPNVNPRPWRRFWVKVRRTDHCWEWQGATRVGYGAFKLDGRTRAAHRLSWSWHHGAVPSGKVLDHLCGNRACVRPDHLEPVTHRENVLRGAEPHLRECPAGGCPSVVSAAAPFEPFVGSLPSSRGGSFRDGAALRVVSGGAVEVLPGAGRPRFTAGAGLHVTSREVRR